MGAIQNAMNQVLGTAAAAITAGDAVKHQKETAKAAEAKEAEAAKNKAELDNEQGLLAKQHFHEASADLIGLNAEAGEAGEALAGKKSEAERLMGARPHRGLTKEALEGKRAKAMTEVEAAQRAFDELQDRIEGKKAMMARAEAIMKRTGTWGGMR